MIDTFTKKYDSLMRLAQSDNEYQAIIAEFYVAEAAYKSLYQDLLPHQQEVLAEFIGRLSELHQRELELTLST